MSLRLHRSPVSGHCHRVELFLSLLGLPVTLVDVDLFGGEQRRPDFLARNAFGQVPVLEDGDATIADSAAILIYLAHRHDPEGRWLPRDAAGAAEVQRWLSAAAGPLAHGPAAARAARLFAVMEGHLTDRRFLVGDRATLADVAMYSYTARAPEGELDLAPYPHLRAWLERVEALPGFSPMPATAPRA